MTARLRPLGTVILTAATLAGLGAALVTPADAAEATESVSYLGHHFTVPANWPVIDLAERPNVCVRFDTHAVYLGNPRQGGNCPAHLVGRTEALLVQPASNDHAPARSVENPVAHEFTASAPGIEVTATYDQDRAQMAAILTNAAFPAPVRSLGGARQRTSGAGAATPAPVPASATVYTGLGFDACSAPSTGEMDAWTGTSPYQAIGIYFGGSERACAQTDLTPDWLSHEAAAGWHFIPIYAGPQASGLTAPDSQGTSAAKDAVAAAQALGLGKGSVLYYDMESYSPGYRDAVLTFQNAWTTELHAEGYRSGFYSSSSSGIADLASNYDNYTMPDVIYDGWYNGVANTDDPNVPSNEWADHQRIHQYRGDNDETYGGVTLDIDNDYLDVQAA